MVSTLAPSRRQNAASLSTAFGSAPLRRRQDAPAVDEQFGKARVGAGIFGAGHRMRRHEMHALRKMRGHVADHRALDRADVGNGGAGRKMRADFLGDRAAGADRNADDDEIGALDRGGVGLDHLIGEAELGHALARCGRARGRHDRAHGALRARCARDRGADQPDADQRQPVEERGRFAHAAFPRNSPSALTTSRLASSVPTRHAQAHSAACRRRPGAGSGRAWSGRRRRPSRCGPWSPENG